MWMQGLCEVLLSCMYPLVALVRDKTSYMCTPPYAGSGLCSPRRGQLCCVAVSRIAQVHRELFILLCRCPAVPCSDWDHAWPQCTHIHFSGWPSWWAVWRWVGRAGWCGWWGWGRMSVYVQWNLFIENTIGTQLAVLYTVEPLYIEHHWDPAGCPV